MITRERLMELLEYDPVTGNGARDAYLAAKQIHHPFSTPQMKETK